MSEAFQVIFNSQGANVINSNAGKTSVVYNVNWGAFLPKKYKNFTANLFLNLKTTEEI